MDNKTDEQTEMLWQPCRTSYAVIAEGFGVNDSKGREIGAKAGVFEETYAPIRRERGQWGYESDLGLRFGFCPSATRGGKAFGASQPDRFFASAAERQAAIVTYFDGARKRAAKLARVEIA